MEEGMYGCFDSEWMRRIEEETVRLAQPAELPEERVRVVAQAVAIRLWQRDLPTHEATKPRSADLTRIIVAEIRKELRAIVREQTLPVEVTNDDGDRLASQGTHDPSRPILCRGLTVVALQGHGVVEFLGLIRSGCVLTLGVGAFHNRRPGRRWTLDPVVVTNSG